MKLNEQGFKKYDRDREEVVMLLMQEKEQLNERCEDLKGKCEEREEVVRVLIEEKEELRARCEKLEKKVEEEEGRKFVDMETWCRLHGWEKKVDEGEQIDEKPKIAFQRLNEMRLVQGCPGSGFERRTILY